MDVIAGKASNEVLEYLLKRRSVKVSDMAEDSIAPSAEQLNEILTATVRVPDHGKLAPFYFLVFEGDARVKAGEILVQACADGNLECEPHKIEKERGRFMRAPLVVGIIMRARMSKNPLWEQMLSAGAAAQNFILAANAQGFAAQWLTEWYAYDENVRRDFGLDDRDIVAGFMYVGQADETPEERDRPDLSLITNSWSPDVVLKKGDEYHREKFGYPDLGFDAERIVKG